MFQVLWLEGVCSIGMFSFFAASMIGLVVLAAKYSVLIRDAENMSITKRKELKAIKTKFLNSYTGQETPEESQYRIQEQINVEVFVDKAVNKLKIGGLKPHTWRFLCGQSVIVSIVFAGVGILRSIMAERTIGEILPFYLFAFLELYIYFSVVSICDFEAKERLLRLTIVEYIENHFMNRIQVARAFQAEEKVIRDLEEEQSRKNTFTKEREQELEALLQEFLI